MISLECESVGMRGRAEAEFRILLQHPAEIASKC